jgi:diguanylate cyclase (GGDEF)-like protein/PAS domain S-box-containing protein
MSHPADTFLRLRLADPVQVLDADEGLALLLGYPAQALLSGQVSLHSRIHPDDQDIANTLLARHSTPASGHFNIRLRHADGGIRCVRGRYSRTAEAGGTGMLLELWLQDARSLQQDLVTPVLANFQAMMESTDDYIYFKDRNHVLTGASQTLVSITPPSLHWSELIGKTDYDIFPEAYADAYYRLEKQVFAGVTVAREIQETQDNSGHKGWVDNRKYPICNEAGEIIGLFGIARDISELKRTQEALQEEHRQLIESAAEHLDILQNLNSGIVVHAPDSRILYSNPSASRLLGLSSAQLQGKVALDPAWRFIYEDGQPIPAARYPVSQILASHTPLKEMVLGVEQPGSAPVIWLMVNGFPVFDAQGALKQAVVNFHDITERKKAEQVVWEKANFDHLTHLPNRRLFHDRLKQQIRQSHRDQASMALLFLDLDRFKEVNDTLGHEMGDLLLIEAARRMKNCLRESDTLARLGGDEFMAILADVHDPAPIGRIAAKLIDALSQPFMLQGQEAAVSASVGIAIYPEDAGSASDLIRHADQAMYTAKEAGRSRFRFFTRHMQEATESRMSLAMDLRHALARQQMSVDYQPIVALASGQIHKAEALLRWKHPQHGFISPEVFIPIAEEFGSIHEIGDWVFMQAARQARRLQHLTGGFQISINKSPVQFAGEHRDHDHWLEHLHTLGLPGSAIAVEITERLLMNPGDTLTDKLQAFREAGIQVALDDFGTGYSSLAYLKKFNIDYLKIDPSFTSGLQPDSPDLALCEAMVLMAHTLGLKVIAEGVETEQQRTLLLDMGCDYGQGWLFARPLPGDELEKLLFPR